MDKPKFNLLDGVILLLIAAIVAVAVLLLSGGDNKATTDVKGQNTDIVFDVEFVNVDKSVYDKFKAIIDNGESVWVGTKDRFEGKLEKLECTPSKKYTSNIHTGEMMINDDPFTYDITVSIKVSAIETDDAFTVLETPIRVGMEALVCGRSVAGYGFITALNPVSKDAQ